MNSQIMFQGLVGGVIIGTLVLIIDLFVFKAPIWAGFGLGVTVGLGFLVFWVLGNK